MSEYARTSEELKEKAVLYWPADIVANEAALTSLPRLLETQDHFLSALVLANADPEVWKRTVDISPDLPANLFLKHLMVMSDLGGEALKKMVPFDAHFPQGTMEYGWKENSYSYRFKAFVAKSPQLTNKNLHVGGIELLKRFALNDKIEDVIMLLLFGASSIGDTLPNDIKDKCMIGTLIGAKDELQLFVQQNYIRISKQLGGATSTRMGQLAQEFVRETLVQALPDWHIYSGTIPGISHNDGRTETNFDIVARSPNNVYFGIEVSFQFTTNSVIERKAREAQVRAGLLHQNGHYICYVVDGAGNINVCHSAVGTICQFSDCTVALSKPEIEHLAAFLRSTVAER